MGFTFHNIWALDQPPLADSTMMGDVAGVTFDNVKYGQKRAASNADLPLAASGGAAAAKFPAPHGPVAEFTVDPPVFAPGEKVTFTAQSSGRARTIPGFLATEPKPRPPRAPSLSRCGGNGTGWRRQRGRALPGSAACRWMTDSDAGLGRAGSGGRGAMARCGPSTPAATAARPDLADLSRRHGPSCPI